MRTETVEIVGFLFWGHCSKKIACVGQKCVQKIQNNCTEDCDKWSLALTLVDSYKEYNKIQWKWWNAVR